MKKISLTITLLILFFSNYALNAPVLLSPSNASSQYTGLTLDWYSVTGMTTSDQYQVQVATDAAFSNIVFDDTEYYINSSSTNEDTKEYIENIFFGTDFFWRVRVIVSGVPESWSTVWTFNTRDYVSLLSPTSGSNEYTGLTLDWYSHPGVDFYLYQIDTSANFD
ncbi:MAG: hypothetical protein JXL97_09950, partial [Bacteroidales bacterium]|nr:hypothetical protein [Bacteroidales bacterium]